MTQTLVATVGRRPFRVRVYVERGRVWCAWSVKGKRQTRSWRDSKANRRTAVTWAERYAAERVRLAQQPEPEVAPRPLTLERLWTMYQLASRKDWRDKTAADYDAYYAALADVFGPQRDVAGIRLEDVDAFKARRREDGIAHSQVRRQIGFLRQLLNWAEGRELVSRNRLRAYRYVIPKDEREALPAEYARAELLRIAAELAAPRHWRARGVITLCGTLGARINAVLHLRWEDVDLDAVTVTWQAAWDKLGDTRTQPLTPMAKAALIEAHGQRHETEPWVFWAVRVKGRPYHYNSVAHHLGEAEKRAGVEHIPGRAFHGLRRMVVGDIGDLRDAGAWVGQKSLKVTAGYDRARQEQVARAADVMARKEGGAA